MPMSRAFFDSNVWIPAIVAPDGFSRRLIVAADDKGSVVVSAELWDEVAEKLALKFGFSWESICAARKFMDEAGEVFADKVTEYPASPDPDDALLLAQALVEKCAHFVTNDKPLLALVAIDEMQIVSPRQFAPLLGVNG
jgi:putative PIN family toxin of toxin-antitoxin system